MVTKTREPKIISGRKLMAALRRLGYERPHVYPCYDLRNRNDDGNTWQAESYGPTDTDKRAYFHTQLKHVGSVRMDGAAFVRSQAQREAWEWLGRYAGLIDNDTVYDGIKYGSLSNDVEW